MANELDFFATPDGVAFQGNVAARGQSSGSLVTDRCAFGYYLNFAGSAEKVDGALRFPGVTVNQGVSVVSAKLGFYIQEKHYSSSIVTKISGIKETNTPLFTPGNSPFGRTKTTANTTPTLDGSLAASGWWSTDVGSLVNEVLGQGGWSNGNAMGFIIEYTGATDTSDRYALDTDTGNSYLSILATANSSFTPTPVTMNAIIKRIESKYGIKVLKAGKTLGKNSESELSFITNKKVLKVKLLGYKTFTNAQGAQSGGESITHNLGYTPIVSSFEKSLGSQIRALDIQPSSNEVGLFADTSRTDVDLFYYIYIDDMNK
jgi:hypothetical protein